MAINEPTQWLIECDGCCESLDIVEHKIYQQCGISEVIAIVENAGWVVTDDIYECYCPNCAKERCLIKSNEREVNK